MEVVDLVALLEVVKVMAAVQVEVATWDTSLHKKRVSKTAQTRRTSPPSNASLYRPLTLFASKPPSKEVTANNCNLPQARGDANGKWRQIVSITEIQAV